MTPDTHPENADELSKENDMAEQEWDGKSELPTAETTPVPHELDCVAYNSLVDYKRSDTNFTKYNTLEKAHEAIHALIQDERAKAVDEFAEQLKDNIGKMARNSSEDLIQYAHSNVILLIDALAPAPRNRQEGEK